MFDICAFFFDITDVWHFELFIMLYSSVFSIDRFHSFPVSFLNFVGCDGVQQTEIVF